MSNLYTASTQAEFQQHVLNSPVLTLVDFWAEWCGPCRSMMPTLDELAALYPNTLRIVKINADESTEIMQNYHVRSLPTLMLFKNGEPADDIKVGALTKDQFINWFAPHFS